MTAEEKAREFLNYVERHHERLRRNLAKNVTFERDLFENTFQDTVLRIHDAILRNDPEISDFEKYFFMASRKWYMTLKGRRDQRRERERRLIGTEEELGQYQELQSATVDEVRKLIEARFGKEDASLFLDYLGSKTMGRTSYSRYGKKIGIPTLTVKEVVVKIKRHMRKKYPNGLTSSAAAEETARILAEKKKRRIEDGLHREEEKELPETE